MNKIWIILSLSIYFFSGVNTTVIAQSEGITVLRPRLLKLKHAEPLSVDLIRDLGARKGEKEWNLGLATGSSAAEVLHYGFIEYEFAPLNRLGVEIELPFIINHYSKKNESPHTAVSPSLKSIKLAAQYTFLVNQPAYLSMAVGYIHEVRLNQRSDYYMSAHLFHPLLIIAKKWGNNIHSMLYVSPVFKSSKPDFRYSQFEINASVHYMTSDGKGFAGVEFNQEIANNLFNVMIRPQVKARLSPSVSVGLCAGLPLTHINDGPDMLVRIIYEP